MLWLDGVNFAHLTGSQLLRLIKIVLPAQFWLDINFTTFKNLIIKYIKDSRDAILKMHQKQQKRGNLWWDLSCTFQTN